MENWIKVEDKKKPRNRENVLVFVPDYCPSGLHVANYDVMTKSFESDCEGMITEYVKMWQRIKKPPKQ